MQGWQTDPFGMHEERYFSAGQPTKLVRDGGTETYDEPPSATAEAPSAAVAAPASAEQPSVHDDPADTPPEAPALVPDVAAVEAATSSVEPESDPADETAACPPSPESEPLPVAAASAASADNSGDFPGVEPADEAAVYLGLLGRQPRGLVYAAVALVAVVGVIAVLAVTGVFSPHPKPGTFGALAQSGSNSGPGPNTGQAPPLDTASAAVVTASAQRTLAQRTADLTVAGTAQGSGRSVPLQGSGQVDFTVNTMSVSVGASYAGESIAETEILTSRNTYLELTVNGRNALAAATTRHWMQMPAVQAGTQILTANSLVWTLQLLEQQPASIAAIGQRAFGQQICTGYAVTPTKGAIAAAAQQEWTQLGLKQGQISTALQALQNTTPAQVTVWINPKRQLACQMSLNMQFSSAPPSTNALLSTAAVTQMSVTFTRYGTPVSISPPSRSDSMLY